MGSQSIQEGSSGNIPLRVLVITGKRNKKQKTLHESRERKRIKDKNLNQQNSRVQSIENFDFRGIGSRGLPGPIFGRRGTRRKKFFETLPLLVKARFFRICRRR
jgi:hypothetical protein